MERKQSSTSILALLLLFFTWFSISAKSTSIAKCDDNLRDLQTTLLLIEEDEHEYFPSCFITLVFKKLK
jgi:nitrate/nitrite transporter NarK